MAKGIAEVNISDSDELKLKKINENFKAIVTGAAPVGAISAQGGGYNMLTTRVGSSLANNTSFASSLGTNNYFAGVLSTYMIDSQYITASRIGVNDLLVDYAQVNFANIDKASISQLWAKHIATENLETSTLVVHKALEAIKITAAMIEAKTITADKLMIKMPDGTTYADIGEFISASNSLWKKLSQSQFSTDEDFAAHIRALAAATGKTEAEVVTELDNGFDGYMIMDGTIRAEALSVDDLYATHAQIGGFHINDPDGEGGIWGLDGDAVLELRPSGYFKAGSTTSYIEVVPGTNFSGGSVNIQATTLRTKEDIVVQDTWKWDMTPQGALNLVYIGA